MRQNHSTKTAASDDKQTQYTIPGTPDCRYSDAYYKTASAGESSYGFNPAFGSAQPIGSERRHTDLGTVLLTCLVCVILAATLGIIGTIIVFRMNASSVEEDTASTEALYAQLTLLAEESEEDEALTLLPLLSSAGMETLSAEEIYAVACQSTVGVTVSGYAENVFGQSNSSSVSGSGIILSEDGYVLTNYHIIKPAYEGGTPISVITYDETEYAAKLVGVEMDSDLAVLKIEAEGLTPAQLGDSGEIRVGQSIYVVGNPLGELTYTMTCGIVSALDRLITTDESITVNMFQIDAAVNNGNSGGPVFNAYGQVIGVVTAKYSESGMEGLGFAIPISDAASIAGELMTNGYVSGKAYLGLTMTTVSASVAQYYDMVQGVYIYAIEPGSCAEKAGLLAGDIITAVDDTAVTTNSQLVTAVKDYRAKDTAVLTVYREGEYIPVTVRFDEELPAQPLSDEEVVLRTGKDLPFAKHEEEGPGEPSGEPSEASGEASAEPQGDAPQP